MRRSAEYQGAPSRNWKTLRVQQTRRPALPLLAPEIVASTETVDRLCAKSGPFAPSAAEVSGGDADSRFPLPIFAEGAGRYAERGWCQGLQTVLVPRPQSGQARIREFAPGSHARRARF